MEADAAAQQSRRSIEQIESADLVVGVLSDLAPDEVAEMRAVLRTLPGSPHTVVLHPHLGADMQNALFSAEEASVSLLPWTLQDQGTPATPVASTLAAYQSIFTIAERLGARGCCVITSKLEHPPSQWILQMTEPLLEPRFDFIAPCYGRRKFEGLLNNSIISPLTRSLYGKRIQNPMGPDLGVSARLFGRILGEDWNTKTRGAGMHLLASLVPVALCENLRVCQAHLGARIYPPVDWTDVSSLLAEILGPVFLTMEKNAPCWQKTRTFTSVEALNRPSPLPPLSGAVEIGRMVNTFQLGNRDLQEIWGLVLPTASLFELRKLARLGPDQFHMPDELWVRIVYDFAVAHRTRTINRDHLLRSLTPLYLGWVASYAREVETADAIDVEARLERLSMVFETEKSYLVSRWRWPDRFNP